MTKRLPLLKLRLENERKRLNVPWNALELDYILSWILYGISSIPELKASLAFKGGTALKKCYFGEYRFSEDLDFSYVGDNKNVVSLEMLLQSACDNAFNQIEVYFQASRLIIEKYKEKQPHPEGQLAFIVRAQLPWHREPIIRVMLEITMQEDVILPLKVLPIIHNYGEDILGQLKVYSLEEIVAEKLRAILQYTKKLHEQSWARSRTRDYYDLWHIFRKYGTTLDHKLIAPTLRLKCARKKVSFKAAEDFFHPLTLAEAESGWQQWLEPLTVDLPEFHTVVAELKGILQLSVFAYK